MIWLLASRVEERVSDVQGSNVVQKTGSLASASPDRVQSPDPRRRGYTGNRMARSHFQLLLSANYDPYGLIRPISACRPSPLKKCREATRKQALKGWQYFTVHAVTHHAETASGYRGRLPLEWTAELGIRAKWHIFPRRVRLMRLVYVGSVFNAVDVQDVVFNVEGEQDAIVAAPCRAQAEQLIREGSAQQTGLSASGPVTNSTIAAAAFSGSRRKPSRGGP